MLAVPENSIMVTGRNGEPKLRKMRASCDACSRAKVKCDKLRPVCHRCNNMNICCNYSPSMRLGKPRKNRNPDGTVIRDVSPAGSCGPLGMRPDMIPRTNIHTAESSPEPTDPYFFCPATPEFHYPDVFMASGFNGGQSPDYSDSSLVNSWSSEEHVMLGAPTDMFTPMPPFLTPQPPFGGHARSDSVQSQSDMFSPPEIFQSPPIGPDHFVGMHDSVLSHQNKMMTSPSPMACAPLPTPPPPPPPPPPHTFVSTARHDCTQRAFQTLHSLYVPSDVDSGGQADGSPTWNDILLITQSAVDSIHNLLECSCSTNPHFSSTMTLSICKILASYQAIARVDDRGNTHTGSTRSESYSRTSNPLGISNASADDDLNLRTTTVLSELRRVEKLVDRFSERYCKNDNSGETGIESGLHYALEAQLRTRVRDTFKVIMRTAPEEVKRQMAFHSQNRARVHTM
ncbi:Zn-II 2Cys6 regulatory protein [Plenodomus tracheiphilus IPT5]|uniref:Zn-II 2Cys6 regulatory protein n=1 Tax=Plenodomus tracheiphilus IPT5 TaxID=1408161 RepID=A0A6A7BKQ0_9PLEO|nr:Zn-II 2Cys6 regulatory protein [Plenodomus tracheiphilus IPT5]